MTNSLLKYHYLQGKVIGIQKTNKLKICLKQILDNHFKSKIFGLKTKFILVIYDL